MDGPIQRVSGTGNLSYILTIRCYPSASGRITSGEFHGDSVLLVVRKVERTIIASRVPIKARFVLTVYVRRPLQAAWSSHS